MYNKLLLISISLLLLLSSIAGVAQSDFIGYNEPAQSNLTLIDTNFNIVDGSDSRSEARIYFVKPLYHNEEIVVRIEGSASLYHEDGTGEFYIAFRSPTGQIISKRTSSEQMINFEAVVAVDMPIGEYIIEMSMSDYPGQCCYSFEYHVSYSSNIPTPYIFNSKQLGQVHDVVGMRYDGVSYVEFSAYFVKDVRYTLNLIPWGDQNLVKSIYLVDLQGNENSLDGTLLFPIISETTGYHTILVEMNAGSNIIGRIWGLQLWRGNQASEDGYMPLYLGPASENSKGDMDGDLIMDHDENETDYLDPDTDNDSMSDGIEVLLGLDPLNYNDSTFHVTGSTNIKRTNFQYEITVYDFNDISSVRYYFYTPDANFTVVSGSMYGWINQVNFSYTVSAEVDYSGKSIVSRWKHGLVLELNYTGYLIALPFYNQIEPTVEPETNDETNDLSNSVSDGPPSLELDFTESLPVNLHAIMISFVLILIFRSRIKKYGSS